MTKSSASSADWQVRREAALVADIGVVAGVLAAPSSACGRSPTPMRRPSAKIGAPTGMIMNSWKSIGLSACAPPLMMFIIGTGSSRADGAADIAVERQAGRDRPPPWRPRARRRGWRWRRAAPCSACRRARSSSRRSATWSSASMPPSASKISPLTASTALRTPLPPIARLVAVAQFDRLMRAGRGARRHRGAAQRAVFQHARRPRRSGCRGCRESRGR